MKDKSLYDELESFKRQLEMAQVYPVDCQLRSTKTAILSMFPTRRLIPLRPKSDHWDAHISGGGIDSLPKRMEAADETLKVQTLYDRDGIPIVNSAGSPIYKDGGWHVCHHIMFKGDRLKGVVNLFERINNWAWNRRDWLKQIGVIPSIPKLPGKGLLIWAEIVLAIAEKSHSALIARPEWYIVIRSHMRMNLKLWKNQILMSEYGLFGLTEKEIEEIGEEPEEIESEREDFIGDSIAAVSELMTLWGIMTDQSLQVDVGDKEKNENNRNTPKENAQRLTTNARMIELIQKNPDAQDYSASQWANALDVAKSTIHDTKTWKDLMRVRRSEGADRQYRQSNASSDKPNAPGKSKKIRPEELL